MRHFPPDPQSTGAALDAAFHVLAWRTQVVETLGGRIRTTCVRADLVQPRFALSLTFALQLELDKHLVRDDAERQAGFAMVQAMLDEALALEPGAPRQAVLARWVATAGEALDAARRAAVAEGPDVLDRWWNSIVPLRACAHAGLAAVTHRFLATCLTTGGWTVEALKQRMTQWPDASRDALLSGLWRHCASAAGAPATSASEAKIRARAAQCLEVAWALPAVGPPVRMAPEGIAAHHRQWRNAVLGALVEMAPNGGAPSAGSGADSGARAESPWVWQRRPPPRPRSLLDHYVPLSAQDQDLTMDQIQRVRLQYPDLSTVPPRALVDLAGRLPLPHLAGPDALEPPRQEEPLTVLLTSLSESVGYLPDLWHAIWDRAGDADTRVMVLVQLQLARRGPWWADARFAREAVAALAACRAADEAVRAAVPLWDILREQWGQGDCDAWLTASFRAMMTVEEWLATIPRRTAAWPAHWQPTPEGLSRLLAHPDGRVRWALQTLCAALPGSATTAPPDQTGAPNATREGRGTMDRRQSQENTR